MQHANQDLSIAIKSIDSSHQPSSIAAAQNDEGQFKNESVIQSDSTPSQLVVDI